MNKKNVLVFPGGSEIGLEVNRSLSASTHFNLFGASSVIDHGKYVYKEYISNLPFIHESAFIEELNKVLLEYKIDFIVPAHDSVVVELSEKQSLLKALVITSNYETCLICRSKKLTSEIFRNTIPVPQMYSLSDKINYPVFLKPNIGQGSRGTHKVQSKEEIDFFLKEDPSLLIMEYLPGKEYTVDCFTDSNGKLLFAEGRERIRINNGISVNSKKCDDKIFLELALKINLTLSFRGVWFFQVKERVDGELVLMEIAPRIAGSMALFRTQGINFIQMSLFDRMGIAITVLNNNLSIEADRALITRYDFNLQYSYVYIDFDDTIIFNNLINTDMIKFIYQSRNQGKKLILLTKHAQDINESLRNFSISPDLFESIIVIQKHAKKSDYIEHKDAIFIDDSFSERKHVYEQKGIPVFSVDAIEALFTYHA